MEISFLSNNTIQIPKPSRPKKMTGTKFAAVLGYNQWSTPFKEWCGITRVYEEPFEDNKYTIAGKTIEPKVAEYLKKNYFLDDLKSPTDVYGKDYFKKTYGNFFADKHKILGGMWDFIGDDYVVEVKTSSRPQDWLEKPPLYYSLQVALYAYLLGIDTIYLTVTFLSDKDYDTPNEFEVNDTNTKIYEMSLSEDFPNFEQQYVIPALQWWDDHIVTGISPVWDEKKDEDIIKELKTQHCAPDDEELETILSNRYLLAMDIENIKIKNQLDQKEKQLKEYNDRIKKFLSENIKDNMDKIETSYGDEIFTLSKSTRNSIDSAKLKKDGLYNKYLKTSTVETLRISNKED